MDAEPPADQPLDFYYNARDLLEAGRALDAMEHLTASWTLAPHAHTAYLLGRATGSLGQVDESRRWFAEAYRLNPRNNMIATAHAAALHDQGRHQEALATVHAVLSTSPTYGPARTLLAALQP